jgi:uroporphyrinogen decarboxylase
LKYSNAIGDVFGKRADRGPLFTFWTHFPADDLDADRLAEATIRLQREFDCDMVKTAPNGMYAVEDLGVDIDFSEVPLGGVARIVSTPYERVEDWAKLPEGDMGKGALARELRSLRLVRAALPDVPIIFTIFSPMTIAAKLSRGRIHSQIAEGADRQLIHAALARLAQTTSAYARAALEAGADGVFLAHQDTGPHLLSYDAFSEYVAPYDIEVLAAASQARFNVLHLHGDGIRFRELRDYPVHAVNWHSWETLPGLKAGALTSGKCVLGGIDRRSVTDNDIPAIRRQMAEAVTTMAGTGDLVLAPSCTIRAGFDAGTITAMRDFIRDPEALRKECQAVQPVAGQAGDTKMRKAG